VSFHPYVCPEDQPGFVGNGVGDDYPAIAAAIAAAKGGQALRFSGTCATSEPINPGSVPIECSGSATVAPVGACPAAFNLTVDCMKHRLPRLLGFPANSLVVSCSENDIEVQSIQGLNVGTGVVLSPNARTNRIYSQLIANLASVLSVSSPGTLATALPIQGNIVKVNFGSACVNGLLFDGSANCDSNTLEFNTWDSTWAGASLPGATIFSSAAKFVQPLSNWRLRITDWIGGLAPGNGWIAKGPFQFCTFRPGGLVTTDWGAIAITYGGGNTFEAGCQSGFAQSFPGNWQAQSNSRTAFGNPQYMNTRRCNGRVQSTIPSGGSLTTYVYTPFCDGNSFGSKAVPVVNPGFILEQVLDNSANVPNEIQLVWRALASISPGSEFDFQFTAGLP
jgi:hypothetical protein